MIDLNEVDQAPPQYDLHAIRDRLADTAQFWVPALFPRGRISPDRKTLRMADLSGRAPRNEGSCVVDLIGPYAGRAHDFATDESAGPIDLIAYKTGLSGRSLFDEAARVAGMDRPAPPPRPKPQVKDHSIEVDRILNECVPLAGTTGEHYLSTRQLSDPECPDLLFNPDVNHYPSHMGYPAMIAIIRDQHGERVGGIHRTYLERDGNSKAPPGKMMLGPVSGGAVQLAPVPSDGQLAIAEGIETALAVTAIFEVACWATLSREHMIAWQCPAAVTHLTIYADKGQPGIEAAHKLADRLRKEGKQCSIKLPLSDDDFNTDLMQGATADEYQGDDSPEAEDVSPPRSFHELALIVKKLPQPAPIEMMSRFLDAMAQANLTKTEQGRLLSELKAISGVRLGDLRADLNDKRKEMTARDGTKPVWLSQLELDLYGSPLRNEDNVQIALMSDPAFAGTIFYDEFARQIIIREPMPWDVRQQSYPRHWIDEDGTHLAMWLQRRGFNVGPLVVARAVSASIGELAIHPVRDYLQSLKWDGKPRIERWALDYLGAEDTPLHRSFGALWMISAVARIMRPGCKADHVLILEGQQGAGKSTALKTLTGEDWFTDEIAEFGSKDAALQAVGAWVIEIAELDALSRSEVSSVKAFLTRTDDRFRPPFGRNVISIPRQCVFAGSVNHDTYLRDETGNRRFWPVRCGTIQLAALARDRDQLWAEAYRRFSDGAIWWLDDPDLIEQAREQQDQRFQVDAWEDQINDWLYNDGVMRRFEPISDVSIPEIMQGALRLEPGKWNRADQMRVSAYLKRNGWERYRARSGHERSWRYRKIS